MVSWGLGDGGAALDDGGGEVEGGGGVTDYLGTGIACQLSRTQVTMRAWGESLWAVVRVTVTQSRMGLSG